MNLLFITEYQIVENKGGVERVSQILSEYFSAKKINTYHLYLKSYDSEIIQGNNTFNFLNTSTNSPENLKLLSEIVKNNNISIVINQMGFNKSVLLLLDFLNSNITVYSCLHSAPDFILTFNSIILSKGIFKSNSLPYNLKIIFKPLYFFYLKRKLKNDLNFIYKKSHRTILLSHNFYNSFVKISKINNPHKLAFIPNPNNPIFKFNLDEFKNKDKTILYVGRLQNGKRVDLILKVWHKLFNEFPNWDLKIIGDGPDLEDLGALSTKLNLKNISFLGNITEVDKHYKKASIFLSLSAFEGFPMVLAEALTFCVVPIIYDTFKSARDLIVNDNTGYLVSDQAEDVLLSRLKQLMKDDILREEMAFNGYIHVKKFNIEKIWRLWRPLLQNN